MTNSNAGPSPNSDAVEADHSTRSAQTLPDFVIIGAMRSGTTSIFRYLGAHPEVCVAGVKEVHFFDRNFERGIDWYSTHFRPGPGHRVVGEATPNYLFDPAVPERMADVIPESRLIAILRDPVERAHSHYWQKRSYGTEPLDFQAAIDAEPERLSMDETSRALYSYVARGRYVGQLKRFAEHFPRERLGVFLFEDLRDRPVETFERVCRFLGVSDRVKPDLLGQELNSYQEYRSARLRALTRRLPGPLQTFIGKLNTTPADHPPLAPTLRDQLVETFESDNRELADWAELDLSAWGGGAPPRPTRDADPMG